MMLAAPFLSFMVALALASSPTRVTVDATEIGTLSPAALDEIAAEATAEAAKHGIEPHELRISLVVLDHLEVIRGIRVAIVTPSLALASPDGDPRGPLVARCQACGEDELKTVSIEGVLEALSRFEQAREAAEAAAAAEADHAASAADPPPPTKPAAAVSPTLDTPSRRPPEPLGWAGVAALSLGAPVLVTGLVFIGLGNDRPPARLPFSQDHVRDFATPGSVLVGVGSAVALAGAVMLGVDRRRARASTLTVAPHAAPTTFGLRLQARF